MSTATDAARLRRRGVQAGRPRWTPGDLQLRLASAAWLGLGALLGFVISLSGQAPARFVPALGVAASAGGGWWLVRRYPPAGAILALIAGAIGVVAGVATGVRYLLLGDVSLRSLAGLASLAAGLALLGGAATILTRRLRWRWRIAAAVPMMAVVVLVGYAVAPGLLATNVPHTDGGTATPADRGIAYENITMRTDDGLTLAGWYVPSRNGAGIVLRHGSGATKSSELDHLEVLARAGFGVLVPDARGRGDSQGEAMDFGWDGESDLRAAIDLLTARPDVDPNRIGIVGISLGGMEAIGAAGADSRIAAVVAEGAIRRSAADLTWLPAAHGPLGILELVMNRLQTLVTELLAGHSAPPPLADSVTSAEASFLLVTAALSDETTAAELMSVRAADRVTVWRVDGASHARGLQTAPDEWTAQVVGFLSDQLVDH